ncbi:MAG: branched-chain amino acid transaminase [Myxococcales bacterium]|nr:branched-chain amino acid transaminase [Myxococcales bacterium]
MITAKSAWMDGKLVPFETCNVHVTAFGLHYGLGVFEGIRAYKRDTGQTGVFRLREHILRLFHSAAACTLEIPYGPEVLELACLEVLRANDLEEAYLRPLVFAGAGSLGLGAVGNPVSTVVFAWPWQTPLGKSGQATGVRAQVSSFVRGHPNSLMTKAKVTGQYAQSVIAKREASRLGFDEAILLDAGGCVAEGTAQNVFAVFGGQLVTPPAHAPILPGITRDAVITLARHLGLSVVEQPFTRDALYQADETFFTGTAVEITPVREVDGRPLGAGQPGPITRRLQAAFEETVRGPGMPWPAWITPV